MDGARGYRGAQGRPPALVVKRLGPLRRSKGPGKLSLLVSPIPRTSRQRHQQGIQEPYPQQPPPPKG
jgi:hypothetical protein